MDDRACFPVQRPDDRSPHVYPAPLWIIEITRPVTGAAGERGAGGGGAAAITGRTLTGTGVVR